MNSKLKVCLSQSGKRQYQIAREVGLTENELSRIVRGRRPATAEERKRLALVLGVTERELFGGDPPQLSLAVSRETGSRSSASGPAAGRSCGSWRADARAATGMNLRAAPSGRS